MARKNKRARSNYLRKDYRKGGRVKLQSGGGFAPSVKQKKMFQRRLDAYQEQLQGNTTDIQRTRLEKDIGELQELLGHDAAPKTPVAAPPRTTTQTSTTPTTTQTSTTPTTTQTSTTSGTTSGPSTKVAATSAQRTTFQNGSQSYTATPDSEYSPYGDRNTDEEGSEESRYQETETGDTETARGARQTGDLFSPDTEDAIAAERARAESVVLQKEGYQPPQIGAPEAVGYKRDAQGNLVDKEGKPIQYDADGNPIGAPVELDPAATKEMGGFVPEGYTVAHPTGNPTRLDPPAGKKWVYDKRGRRLAVDDDLISKAQAGQARKVGRYYASTQTRPTDIADPDAIDAGTYKAAGPGFDPRDWTAAQGAVTQGKIENIQGAIRRPGIPEGYSETPPAGVNYPAVEPPEGMKWAYGPGGDRIPISKTAGTQFATVDDVAATAAKASKIDDVLGPDSDYLVKEVEGEDTTISPTSDAEVATREQITGTKASGTEASIIETVGYEAAKQRVVKGVAAQRGAATMLAEVGGLPPDITAAIVEDPATVTAQVDTNPVEVNAAIAALPTEALVSSQMDSLLGSMEGGEVPIWAKPAVDAINQRMAERGLSVSTVGRDALFNSIVQSAMPIAQSNAQALQARAAQNLSNEQQANLQQATQEQQLRLANLANQQTSESQTAQMSQQMKTMQSQFRQDAVMASAAQAQQSRMQDLQNRQEASRVQAQMDQQAAMTNLGNEQQLNMAELQIDAAVQGADQSAENQEKMAEMQIAADFLAKNAGFKQQMELANLGNDQQMRLANLSSKNLYQSETFSNEEKIELANLNKTMQSNLTQAQIASQMGIAQLNVDQQSAIQNASIHANMDLTKFSDAQKVELANSKFMQSVALADMNAEQQAIMQNATAQASMDIANLNTAERLAVTNAQNFLQMDMANLSNKQQAFILKNQQKQQKILSTQAAENAARQFNATSENQTNQFMTNMSVQVDQYNSQQLNAQKQFNAQQINASKAQQRQLNADISKSNAAMATSINQFNAQNEFNREQWNQQNAQAVEQSNVAWRRQANTANTAAANAVNMQNAQNAFNMSSQAQSFLWQEMRDRANYDWQAAENFENRKTQVISQALQNEGDLAKVWKTVESANWTNLLGSVFGDKTTGSE